MKKYLIALSALFLFTACDELFPDREKTGPEEFEGFVTVGLTDKIEISDVEMIYAVEITDVALVARFHGHQGYGTTENSDGEDTRVMVRGITFDRESMTIELPENPPQELLRDIATDFPAGFEFSDPEAQTISNVQVACDFSDLHGSYYKFLHQYMAADFVSYELKYIYCDREVTVTGQGADWWSNPTTYDLHFEKGWNMYVEKEDWTGFLKYKTINHRMPAGIPWKLNMIIGGC